jgi:murein L,D-transpeptidase YcbB/YkuD
VLWIYLTGWVTPDGTLHFRDDIYRRNPVKAAEAELHSELRQ